MGMSYHGRPQNFVHGDQPPAPATIRCPVCRETAQDLTPASSAGKSIKCATCGEFDISVTAWTAEKLNRIDFARRSFALRRARVRAKGTRPMILSVDC
jgi:hypothetical protein